MQMIPQHPSPERQLLVEEARLGEVTVVSPKGEIDTASVEGLREHLLSLAAEGRVHVVLDLNGIAFMDSVGLGAIVATRRRFQTLKGRLVLASAQPVIERLLRLTSLHKVVPVYATVDEALTREFSV